MTQPKMLVARKGPGARRPRTVQLVQPAPVMAAPGAAAASNPFVSAPTLPGQAPPLAAAAAPNAFASTSAQPYAAPPPGFGAPPPPGFGAPLVQPVNDLSASRKRKASHAPLHNGGADAHAYPYPPPPQGYPYPGYPYPYAPPHDPSAAAPPPPQVPGYGSAPRLSAADYRLKGHTLGERAPDGPAQLDEADKRELVPAYALYDREVTFRVSNRASEIGEGGGERERKRRALAVPAVVSFGRLGVEDGDKDTFEYRNFAEGPRASLFRSFSFSPSCTAGRARCASRTDSEQRRPFCRQGRERGDGHDGQEGALDRLPAQVRRLRGREPGLYGRVPRGRELDRLEPDRKKVRSVSSLSPLSSPPPSSSSRRRRTATLMLCISSQAHPDPRPRRAVLVPRRRGLVPPRPLGAWHPHRLELVALDPQAPLDLPSPQHLGAPLVGRHSSRPHADHHDERAPPQRHAAPRPLDRRHLQLRRRPRELDSGLRAVVGALRGVGRPARPARGGESRRARHRQEHRGRRQRDRRRRAGAQGARGRRRLGRRAERVGHRGRRRVGRQAERRRRDGRERREGDDRQGQEQGGRRRRAREPGDDARTDTGQAHGPPRRVAGAERRLGAVPHRRRARAPRDAPQRRRRPRLAERVPPLPPPVRQEARRRGPAQQGRGARSRAAWAHLPVRALSLSPRSNLRPTLTSCLLARSKPGKKDGDEWASTVLGLSKRDLLRDVLRELGTSSSSHELSTLSASPFSLRRG